MNRLKTVPFLPFPRSTISPDDDSKHAIAVDLAEHAFMPVAHHTGVSVLCRTGLLWITGRGIAEDVVLNDGQQVDIAGCQDILIQALRASLFEIRQTRNAT